MNAHSDIKAGRRIDRALAGNAKIDQLIDALGQLKCTRVHCARTGRYFSELKLEYQIAGLLADALNFDLETTREDIRDELWKEHNWCAIEQKRINPKTGELVG